MNAPHAPALAGILPDIVRKLPAGTWTELGTATTTTWQPGAVFEAAGWRAARPGAAAQWLTVYGNALADLAGWLDGAERPPLIAVPAAVFAQEGPAQPAWLQVLARDGYAFGGDDEQYAYFVRADEPGLQSAVAQLASRFWRTRLQTNSHVHAQAARAAEQGRKAALKAQTQIDTARAEVQALQLQLAAVYASTSWQITKPVRWLSRLARQPRSALRQLAGFGVAALRGLLRRTIAHVLASPWLRRRLAPLALRHPALLRRVKSLLRPSAPVVHAPDAPPVIHPNNIVGPQFKTLLLNELDRGMLPASHQG